MAASTKKGGKPKAPRETRPARLFVNDRWTLDLCELGRDREADHLARMALLCQPPFVTALAGRGGSGKTSVMRYAMTLLGGGTTRIQLPSHGAVIRDDSYGGEDRVEAIRARGRELMSQHGAVGLGAVGPRAGTDANPLSQRALCRVATAWFNPWRSRDQSNPVASLLMSLHEQLTVWGRNVAWTATHARAHFEAGLHLLRQLAESAAAADPVAPLAVSQLESGAMRVAGALDRGRVGQLEQISDGERFRLLFEHAIESVLGVVDAKSKRKGKPTVEFASAEQHRLVIFVDDLERCGGATIVRVLEAVELYLSTRYCVFVFGTDVRALRAGLRAHWPECAPAVIDDTLERSFQSQMLLAHSRRCPLFIHNRLAAWELIDAPAIPAQDYRDRSTVHPLARLIADVLPANPRKIKSFLNGLRLSWEVARTRLDDLRPEELTRFALVHRLQVSAPQVFELLGRDTEYHLRALQDFFEHCKNRTPYRPDPAHGAACVIMVDAFRPMVNLDSEWRDPAIAMLPPSAAVEVAVEQLLADRQFARLWRDAGLDAGAVRRYAGWVGVP